MDEKEEMELYKYYGEVFNELCGIEGRLWALKRSIINKQIEIGKKYNL